MLGVVEGDGGGGGGGLLAATLGLGVAGTAAVHLPLVHLELLLAQSVSTNLIMHLHRTLGNIAVGQGVCPQHFKRLKQLHYLCPCNKCHHQQLF